MFKKMTRGYNLQLVFAKRNGGYISNVQVAIKGVDQIGFLKTESCGPWFAAKLPEGTYQVYVSYNGDRHFRELTVGGMRQTLMFNWS